jgi:hypothetical protein
MPAIQEIAGYLSQVSAVLPAMLQNQPASGPSFRQELELLEEFRDRAQEFYDRAMKNSKSPWRTVSSYKDLDRAFIASQGAFTDRASYLLDPRAFEEAAYLMGALLQYYTEPVYTVTVYGYYPRVTYGWIPSFYTFAGCRFANPRVYPWSRFVRLGTPHR